ncbi:bifunctional demethylmenaquinone methyltransferase/2-methoxy-6-polyprenyl-1,4-benzoquinol methylase UbiE [Zavarzinia compransoris]|uniref:Ubiquinone/menaquinone biosynthesis C-methyltransferase UbiE n=1 Tax=Zavarzinia compransoris TaxID=1264899 RepID=A0A317E1J4_9PROT|nr:bifunctional demethylmenaquinone methyltransferase/2-methoxy-6-polyprenyl-1,4-benzoquinol methylase UbiE [Zavarzinia compransoris]PWR20482.1 bifunctional demethylmenaquinone methyltransferase/2-methoxy-6-polyprenyl-1,4-benzoquinol methylase UbiE [Zavarzinia compransoris]TDP43874.1 demethylmenaquinone methyltransferase/2-methoxy-6-polyprenyl-1,4-benzoquinol methylase [Zavarzinia compransoris]
MSQDSQHPAGADSTTHFGFETVAEQDKARRVRGVFDAVAKRYDVMNDFMSGGVHRLWKTAMIDWLNPAPRSRLLDVAGGTGDIAFRFLDKAGDGAHVTVADINAEMIVVGRDRALDQGRLALDWTVGDAERLPFADRSFDYVTIAFGIRNVTRIPVALKDMRRVLKPGGRFMCLEFSKVVVPGMDRVYEDYSFKVIPRIGGLVAGNADAYRYLVESIRRFPDQDTFAAMLREAGFEQVQYRNLTGGVAAIHSGWRL